MHDLLGRIRRVAVRLVDEVEPATVVQRRHERKAFHVRELQHVLQIDRSGVECTRGKALRFLSDLLLLRRRQDLLPVQVHRERRVPFGESEEGGGRVVFVPLLKLVEQPEPEVLIGERMRVLVGEHDL